MPGPKPKPADQRRRQNATPGFRQLPLEGRTDPAPSWPTGKPTVEELNYWEHLWTLPQAVEWERLQVERIVAQYVRVFCACQEDPTNTKLASESRQLDLSLGVSPKAMRALSWELEPPPKAPREAKQATPEPPTVRAYVPRQATAS